MSTKPGMVMWARMFVSLLLVAFPAWAVASDPPKRVVLVGDSTMATRTGYGDAFCQLLQPGVSCVNLARGGRSSGSFRAEGLWDGMLTLLDGSKEVTAATLVLIQFGHNDQPGKPGRSTDLRTEFPVNIERYVDEVRRAGATPVLVTPLTRRTFREGVLQNDLAPWADAARRIASEKGVVLLDLNADSSSAVQKMGSAEADTFAEEPPRPKAPVNTDKSTAEPAGLPPSRFDHTHLGAKGASYFARMVAQELALAVPALAPQFQSNALQSLEPRRPQLSDGQAAQFTVQAVLAGANGKDKWLPLRDSLVTSVQSKLKPDYVVDRRAKPDNRRVFNTVQSAANRALVDSENGRVAKRRHIQVMPGVYEELLYIPATAPPLTIYSNDGDASHTVIRANLNAGTTGEDYGRRFGAGFDGMHAAIVAMYTSVKEKPVVGTPGSTIAWIRSPGFQARNITFENAWNRGEVKQETPIEITRQLVQTFNQALAVMIEGADKSQFENVRFLGLQDTLFLTTSQDAPHATVRSFFHRSYIEGDTDFIFGDATAYFYRSEIRSRGVHKNYSYVTAASTSIHTPYGFVFNESRFTHDGTPNALAGKFHLGRQWFRGQRCTPYSKVPDIAGYSCMPGDRDVQATDAAPQGTISTAVLESVGKVVIMNSHIGAHIDKARPWSDWNRIGARQYRPAQYDSNDFRDNLERAGIAPERAFGYGARPAPAQPYLAEFHSVDD
ncbi:MAG: pectinesterase family protein [Betaproteobacteria bacterium]